jgi:hypothetical protein
MLVTVSCLFYTLFLFDTLGDAAGFRGAYWVFIVMPLVPLCLYAAVQTAGQLLPKPTAQLTEAHGDESVVELRSTGSSLDKLERAQSAITVSMLHKSLPLIVEN